MAFFFPGKYHVSDILNASVSTNFKALPLAGFEFVSHVAMEHFRITFHGAVFGGVKHPIRLHIFAREL